MVLQSAKRWRSALQDKVFRDKFIITGVLLGLCAAVAPFLFKFIQQRNGFILNDYVLDWLPAYELSVWIFLLLYVLIVSGILILFQDPHRMLIALQAYIILTVLRFITMLLFPLEPPEKIIVLNDPLVQYFFYQQTVTKDLFFSGHTSVLFLITLSITHARLRLVYLLGTFALAAMLLFQHAHYTIDVLAAPLFAWLALTLARKIP